MPTMRGNAVSRVPGAACQMSACVAGWSIQFPAWRDARDGGASVHLSLCLHINVPFLRLFAVSGSGLAQIIGFQLVSKASTGLFTLALSKSNINKELWGE